MNVLLELSNLSSSIKNKLDELQKSVLVDSRISTRTSSINYVIEQLQDLLEFVESPFNPGESTNHLLLVKDRVIQTLIDCSVNGCESPQEVVNKKRLHETMKKLFV